MEATISTDLVIKWSYSGFTALGWVVQQPVKTHGTVLDSLEAEVLVWHVVGVVILYVGKYIGGTI